MRNQLAETLGEVFWSDLHAHAARDSVIIVAEELDLLDVGEAMAANDVPAVSAWISAGMLTKPSAADLASWPLSPQIRFRSVIVAPYVLIHRPSPPEPS
ncbi:MAG: DUF2288 domain-containing protein [Polyangiaceae bacterium]|nr:DUF2288 domain-containing protein [Polyangiaceae bacterium]NUQ73445.1 DUF2288 domain-containing protein [Polyangiaceae bacterium]